MQTATELTRYYAARAREYESIYDKPERQADLATLRRIIPAYFANRDVLEIACGTGYWTQRIAAQARRVTAVDINEETLEIARAKPPAGNVTFERADVNDLSRYRGYSGAFAGFWWSHMLRSETPRFLETLHRALTPGAVIVALDNRYVEGSSTPISHVDAAGNSYQKRRLADGSEHTVLKNFPTQQELFADIGRRGVAVDYVALDYYWLLKYEVVA